MATGSSGVKSPVRSPKKEWDASAVGNDEWLASISRRLDLMEKRLVGKRGLREGYPPLSPSLKACQEKLEGSLDSGSQAIIHTLWNKIDQLEKMLDPNFGKTTPASEAAVEDLLVGYVDKLKAVYKKMEELQQLKDYINSTEFQGLVQHEKRLAGVASTHSQQEQEVGDISYQAQRLVKLYGQVMMQLSTQCVTWEEEVRKIEV